MKLLLKRTGLKSVDIEEEDFRRAVYKYIDMLHRETGREVMLEADDPDAMPYVIVPNKRARGGQS